MSTTRKIIAVVDDDPSALGAAESLLDAHGFGTALFSSAEEFLAHGLLSNVHCLLLDINLSGLSGIELRKQLISLGSNVPVIFMTAVDDNVILEQAIESGCVACLRKPFSGRKLIDAIASSVS